MTRIGALKGITRKETRQLRGKGIRTIDGLWARIGQDLDEGIGRAVEGTDIELGRLKELLAAQSVREGKKGQGSWPRQHWIEIVSVLAVAVLAALVLYTLVLKPEHPLANQVVVKADAGLPALQVIGPDDVGLEEVPQESGAFQKPSDVVGRYPLEEIPSGSTLRAAQLGETSLSLADLEDRYLLSIPVKAQALSPTVRPTDRVSLLFSPRELSAGTPSPIIRKDLVVWAIDRGGEAPSITIAGTVEDLKAMKPLLGISEVFVVSPAPKESG